MSGTKLHVTSNNLVIKALLGFGVEKTRQIRQRSGGQGIQGANRVSPLETNPMLSKGSCFTGRSLSHGADVFRLKGGGG